MTNELEEHIEAKSSKELEVDLNELNRKIKDNERQIREAEQKIAILREDLDSLNRTKEALQIMMEQKQDERFNENITEKRHDDDDQKKLFAYLDEISHCPQCPIKFEGTPSERERARKAHIKSMHPGKKRNELE